MRGRQSFLSWKLPRALDGLVLLEDLTQPGTRYRSQERHSHAELELHFIERGHAVFVLRDRKLHAPAGTLLWIPPRREHLVLEVSPDVRRWLLLVRARAARRVLPAASHTGVLGAAASERWALLTPRAASQLRAALCEAQAVGHDAREALGLANAGACYALARAHVSFCAAPEPQATSAFHPSVVRALAALRTRVPPPSLPELAKLAHASEAHLSKLFAAQVGVSITELRNRLRLQRFAELYGDGSTRTRMSAALDAGFGSYAQFYRVYKQQLGHAPGRPES
jgi:AraC-like DNA-binding protein